jgi:hypothetical protein
MRAVAGVVVAFIVMSVLVLALSLAPWYLLGVDAVLEPGRFDSTPAFDAWAVIVGVAGAVLAGWICAAIGRSRIAVSILAVICVAGGFVNHFSQHHKPEPGVRAAGVSVMDAVNQRKEADWFTLLMPCLGAAGVLVGSGLAAARRP